MNATVKQAIGHDRIFLFLQGPHGPFFSQLSERLTATGRTCWRVAFNAGDVAGWKAQNTLLKFKDQPDAWPEQFAKWIKETGTTDLVLYGDTRRRHAVAIQIAKKHKLRIHVFEEGYLRPYWATYERNGSNGNSRLMEITLKEMSEARTALPVHRLPPPDRWGDLRQHMFYGAAYHWYLLARNHGFPNYKAHRDQSVREEFVLQVMRLLRRPRHIVERWLSTRSIRSKGWPYHVVLLQLEHDASFRAFSPFASQTDFVELVFKGFAAGAPSHHRLVFKAHPLEDGRAPLEHTIRECADKYGMRDRVSYVRGGKLAYLLKAARSAVTVNSTSAQQALWRGLPVKCFGTAVYDKPGLVSDQALADFFARPLPPNPELYATYRQFLLETSQLPGGFYSAKGRAALMQTVIDLMLETHDPYDLRLRPRESKSQQLRLVR